MGETVLLYTALVVFGLGLIYRVGTWFRQSVGVGPRDIAMGNRFLAAIKGMVSAVFSRRIGSLIATFIVDVNLQIRILKDCTGPLVWIFHILIFVGFMGLLIMHALDDLLANLLFSNYQPTLNPYMFLRNLFGVMVLAGLLLALLRRIWFRRQIRTGAGDIFAIVLLFLIMMSGFWLEATKISSYSAYQAMVKDYSSAEEPEEAKALEAYWVKYYGLVSPNDLSSVTPEALADIEPLHQEDCGYCHTPPTAAFLSYAFSQATKADALAKDAMGLPLILSIIHYVLCLIGLAYLPFGKMFHVIATPLSLLVAAGSKRKADEANIVNRQMIERAGCGHGGTCHLSCPVRIRREERIEGTSQFGSAVTFMETADAATLGSRKFSQ